MDLNIKTGLQNLASMNTFAISKLGEDVQFSRTVEQYPIIDVSSWATCPLIYFHGPKYFRENEWLIDKEQRMAVIFKPRFINRKGKIYGDDWAEKLAACVGRLSSTECAKVELAERNSLRGCISYSVINYGSTLVEVEQYLRDYFKGVDLNSPKITKEDYIGKYYTFNAIYNIMKGLGLEKDFCKVLIFDCLIGNTDRNPSNLAIEENKRLSLRRLSPLYDNGMSLGCELADNEVRALLSDNVKYRKYIEEDVRSRIGLNGSWVSHYEMIRVLKEFFGDDIRGIIEIFGDNITRNSVIAMIDGFSEEILSTDRKYFLFRFLLDRRNFIAS